MLNPPGGLKRWTLLILVGLYGLSLTLLADGRAYETTWKGFEVSFSFLPNVSLEPGDDTSQEYMVWVFKFENDTSKECYISDDYSLVTDMKEQREPLDTEPAEKLIKQLEKKHEIKDERYSIGTIYPKAVKHQVVVFDKLPQKVKGFTLYCDDVYEGRADLILKYKKDYRGIWKRVSKEKNWKR